jgi:hypothetical protein
MSEPYGLIYCVSFPNDKKYIGQTCRDLSRRVIEHNHAANKLPTKMFHRAINKYFNGSLIESQYEILDVAYSKEELTNLEIEYIKKFDSFGKNGYNMTIGGEGVKGYIYTDDDRKKMSEIALEFYKSHPEHSAKMSIMRKKYYEDNPEARQKASENTKNYFKNNPEKKEEHSKLMKQKYEDDPSLSEKNRERSIKYCEDHPERMLEHSEYLIKYWSDPEKRLEQSITKKEQYKNNPDMLVKMSEVTKNLWKSEEFKNKQKSTRRDKCRINTFYVYNVATGSKLEGEWNNVPECIESIAPQFSENQGLLIKQVLDGKRKSSRGFRFEYKE